MHGFQLLIARNYIGKPARRSEKGHEGKSRARHLSRTPALGYRNKKIEYTIKIRPENAEVVKRIFRTVRDRQLLPCRIAPVIRTETGKSITKTHIHDGILRDQFYLGFFTWDGDQHNGSQPAIITPALFQRVQDFLDGHNKPRYQKPEFAFGGRWDWDSTRS
jgi:hypothetical protein